MQWEFLELCNARIDFKEQRYFHNMAQIQMANVENGARLKISQSTHSYSPPTIYFVRSIEKSSWNGIMVLSKQEVSISTFLITGSFKMLSILLSLLQVRSFLIRFTIHHKSRESTYTYFPRRISKCKDIDKWVGLGENTQLLHFTHVSNHNRAPACTSWTFPDSAFYL